MMKLYPLDIFILLMSKDLKFEHKEDKAVRPREERFLNPAELYSYRKSSHSRAKAASKLEKHVTAFEK
jgi:hypothetical protein